MAYFTEARWGSLDTQECPYCKMVGSHHYRAPQKRWRCKRCHKFFSVTSQTKFADRKLSYRDLLVIFYKFANAPKGISAISLMNECGHAYQNVFVTLAKVREALVEAQDMTPLTGVVHFDGAYVSGVLHKPTEKKNMKKARAAVFAQFKQKHGYKMPSWADKDHPDRRVVMVAAQASGVAGMGPTRIKVAVCLSENPHDSLALAKKWIAPGTEIWTDESKAFDGFSKAGFIRKSVCHKLEYCSPEGFSDNFAESFFSQMRRTIRGTYHRVTKHYMQDYMVEMAWRYEHRRLDTRQKLQLLLRMILSTGRSTDWLNYSRNDRKNGKKRQEEHLFSVRPAPRSIVRSRPRLMSRGQSPAGRLSAPLPPAANHSASQGPPS